MMQMTQNEIEERIKNINQELLVSADKYFKLQEQMVNAQGFVSLRLQTEVENAKNEYINLKDELNELENILSYLDEE